MLTNTIWVTYLRAEGIGQEGPALPGERALISRLYDAETENLGYLMRSVSAGGSGSKLPMNMNSVESVSEKYGLDLRGIPINIDKRIGGVYRETTPEGTVNLYRNAFTSEEQLARTLAHEAFHVGQIAVNGYPEDIEEFINYEAEAQAYEAEWWASATEP